ncbi:MAG: DUF1501 domain-containing protein [Cyanobacteria bacterium J06598_3]
MKRRHFLQHAALAGATGIISAGLHGWAWKNPSQAASNHTPPRLIVILLRGAADGLNIVVPYQASHYYKARPTIAIAPPGETNGALDLNGEFGLHPALQALMPHWQNQNLAFVPACGLPVLSRSHFAAQDNLERGMVGSARSVAGWLNRLLAFLPNNHPTQAVGMGRNAPLILQGPQSVANLAITGAGLRPLPIDRPQIHTYFDQLYARDTRLGPIYHEGRMARDILLRQINEEAMEASRGAPSPGRFANSARYLAQLMVGDSSTQVAFLELGQWDTHVNERGILNRNLRLLGDGLAVLAQELGDVYQNTAIVVMSEFGRTIAENGNGGTDHGYGNALWLMGGAIKGQQMYGEWPGLAPAQQHQSRDLEITTDFRDVLGSLLAAEKSVEVHTLEIPEQAR